MGQKVNPHSFRVGPTLIKSWDSVLYAKKNYSALLLEDVSIRNLIFSKCSQAQVSRVLIQRVSSKTLIVDMYVRKPGVIIGKNGADVDKLKSQIAQITSYDIFININEVKKPAVNSSIVAKTIAAQLEKRGSFRRAMKMAMQSALKQGAKGIKVKCSGRLGGAEIARFEWYMEGRVPLHTLRADICYSTAEAITAYGVIGVKVWIYNGEYNEKKGIIG